MWQPIEIFTGSRRWTSRMILSRLLAGTRPSAPVRRAAFTAQSPLRDGRTGRLDSCRSALGPLSTLGHRLAPRPLGRLHR